MKINEVIVEAGQVQQVSDKSVKSVPRGFWAGVGQSLAPDTMNAYQQAVKQQAGMADKAWELEKRGKYTKQTRIQNVINTLFNQAKNNNNTIDEQDIRDIFSSYLEEAIPTGNVEELVQYAINMLQQRGVKVTNKAFDNKSFGDIQVPQGKKLEVKHSNGYVYTKKPDGFWTVDNPGTVSAPMTAAEADAAKLDSLTKTSTGIVSARFVPDVAPKTTKARRPK